MKYNLIITPCAQEDMRKLKLSGDKQAIKKLERLLEELKEHPRTGTGKPKPLTGFATERWSRRITDKHRLVYDIYENNVLINIVQAWGHYHDK